MNKLENLSLKELILLYEHSTCKSDKLIDAEIQRRYGVSILDDEDEEETEYPFERRIYPRSIHKLFAVIFLVLTLVFIYLTVTSII